MENDIATQIIVDLYEMRATTLPYKGDMYQNVENLHKYNFMNSAIAQICDKYKVSHRDITEEIHKRQLATQYNVDNI